MFLSYGIFIVIVTVIVIMKWNSTSIDEWYHNGLHHIKCWHRYCYHIAIDIVIISVEEIMKQLVIRERPFHSKVNAWIVLLLMWLRMHCIYICMWANHCKKTRFECLPGLCLPYPCKINHFKLILLVGWSSSKKIPSEDSIRDFLTYRRLFWAILL